MDCQRVLTPWGFSIFYTGPALSEGPLPAFFYFALAGEESLTLSPYNSPIIPLHGTSLRVFSFTLPFHGEGFNKFHAMEGWLNSLHKGENFLENFFKEAIKAISWLIDSGIVDPTYMATGGLSRGGFIATHLAAREPRIRYVLAFAPLTSLKELAEYASFLNDISFSTLLDGLSVHSLIPSLLHLHSLRFYIGNRDTRVNTDAAFQFIRLFADAIHDHHKRHCQAELLITHSIGRGGHGTPPHIFIEGAEWVKHQLLNHLGST